MAGDPDGVATEPQAPAWHGTYRQFLLLQSFLGWRDGISDAEMRLLQVCQRALPSDRRWIAVDVGAHLGHFALALAALGFDEVHAFEPIPDTYRHLQQNIAMNARLADRVTVHPLGVSDAPGSAGFTIRANSPGQNRIAIAADQRDSHDVRCLLTCLDEQFANRPEAFLGMVKIDVEGFETAVIRGATRLLAEDRVMFVYTEMIPQALHEAGSSAEELVATLEAANLILVRLVTLPRPTLVQCSLPETLDPGRGRGQLKARASSRS